ncbi:MAG: hypothetical protein ACOCQD_04695 [archaeon]
MKKILILLVVLLLTSLTLSSVSAVLMTLQYEGGSSAAQSVPRGTDVAYEYTSFEFGSDEVATTITLYTEDYEVVETLVQSTDVGGIDFTFDSFSTIDLSGDYIIHGLAENLETNSQAVDMLELTVFDVVTNLTTLTPVIEYSNNQINGFCNSENDDLVNYRWQWYFGDELVSESDSLWCHQETANESTFCGSLNTGTYNIEPNFLYINYSKHPLANSNSLWTSKHGELETYNSSIANSCWDAYEDKLVLRFLSNGTSDYPGLFESFGECYDGVNWITITNIETVTSIFASSTISDALDMIDADYSTHVMYYGVLENWGTCTNYDCNSARVYEESMQWNLNSQFTPNQLINIENISVEEFNEGEWILSCQAIDEEEAGLWVNSSVLLIEDSSSTLCQDSDGGIDYFTKGTILTPNVVSKTDHCTNEPWGTHTANLIEYYCLPDQTRAAYGYNCPYGCTDGACNSEPEIIDAPVLQDEFVGISIQKEIKPINSFGKQSLQKKIL